MLSEFLSGALSLVLLPVVIWDFATPDTAGFKDLDRSSSIAGIDKNANGIRDDIEKQIDQRISLPNPRKLLKNFTKYNQEMMVNPQALTTHKEFINYHIGHSMACLYTLKYQADRYTVKTHNYEQIEFLKNNPDTRTEAEKQYDLKLYQETKDAINIAVRIDNILGNTKKRKAQFDAALPYFEPTLLDAMRYSENYNCKDYMQSHVP